MGNLDGQVAWVTGAGGGIGEASAKQLAEAGATVVLSGRREGPLEEVAAAIRDAGGKAEVVAVDVADRASTETAAKGIVERHGRLDIVVANAGINVVNRGMKDITAEDFGRVVDINLTGIMNCVMPVIEDMRKAGGGLIIMVSSWAGRHASKLTGAAYNASKHGVVALNHSINMEEGVNGIRSCVVMPGEVNTPIMDKRPVPPSAGDRARMLQPEDLGRAVRFVAESPAHVCINEMLISPTWNRTFVPPELLAEAGKG